MQSGKVFQGEGKQKFQALYQLTLLSPVFHSYFIKFIFLQEAERMATQTLFKSRLFNCTWMKVKKDRVDFTEKPKRKKHTNLAFLQL